MADLFSIALTRCVSPTFASSAKAIHSHFIKCGSFSNLHRLSGTLAAYCKCGMVDDAHQLFDEIGTSQSFLDVVCWNALISGCVQNARDEDAFRHFKRMQSYFSADSYTFSSILSSTLCLERSMDCGKSIHGYALKSGNLPALSVGNALITFYAAWNHLPEANKIFDKMSQRNVVTWSALISGYAQRRGLEEESLRLFVQMMSDEGEQRPNHFTFASAFSACGTIACLSLGIALMSLAFKMGQVFNMHVQNSLVCFYSDCGCLEDALAVFDTIVEPDIVSWNSLLKGYSNQGRGTEALQIFKEMCKKGTNPDSITFLSVLSACCHSGMTLEGLELFLSMGQDYAVKPRTEHVSCIVGLLGRAGLVHEAKAFIRGVQCELGPSVWRTLLGACRVHNNVELAEWAAEKLLELEPCDSETHVVLSHIYAANGRWDMVRTLRCSMKEKVVGKEPGMSWIEVCSKVHSFMATDASHSNMAGIKMMLVKLTNNMKDETPWVQAARKTK